MKIHLLVQQFLETEKSNLEIRASHSGKKRFFKNVNLPSK